MVSGCGRQAIISKGASLIQKMKKIIMTAVIFGLVLSAGRAYAEEAVIEATIKTSTGETIKVPVRAQVKSTKAEVKSEIETRKQELETKRAEVKAELKTEAKTRAANSIAKTIKKSSERLSAELRRFRDIQSKIETRLAKLEGQGADTRDARAVLAVAVTKLSAAETSINAIANVTISADDPRSSLDAVKAAVRSAQDALKEAHKSLSDVLPAMKGLEASVKRNATSTKATNQ